MRRIAIAAAAVALTAGLAAAPSATATTAPAKTPSPAAAAPVHFSGSNCPSNSLCLYRDSNFNGGGIALKRGDGIGYLGDYGFNDQMSSWSNDSGTTCYWWVDAYKGGAIHDMRNGYRVNVLASENDTASSVQC
ncbi:peptidase inhibitor family I36 protein [Streptomyces tsukubensis]|uniref:peptidase inhibitor family I36 protein n=1 Tax=Streptomyces tsukubensis TaxID=83656 RepID=UPI00369DF7B3